MAFGIKNGEKRYLLLINCSMAEKRSIYPRFSTQIKILLLIIIGILSSNYVYKIHQKKINNNCYQLCSDYHLLGEAYHWNYNDFVIDNEDTIWVDEECYNDWCICIDECNPGLCCELLR